MEQKDYGLGVFIFTHYCTIIYIYIFIFFVAVRPFSYFISYLFGKIVAVSYFGKRQEI